MRTAVDETRIVYQEKNPIQGEIQAGNYRYNSFAVACYTTGTTGLDASIIIDVDLTSRAIPSSL